MGCLSRDPVISMRIAVLILLATALAACSGTEVIPDDTATFAATGYKTYAWLSEPLGQSGYNKSKIYQVDPVLRASVDERMQALGYRRVDRADAEFLVEYLAAEGVSSGVVAGSASNVRSYPVATINRIPDGATVDNAYALAAPRDTGTVAIVFLDSEGSTLLWRVRISALIEDANKVNVRGLERAVRQGLANIPPVQ